MKRLSDKKVSDEIKGLAVKVRRLDLQHKQSSPEYVARMKMIYDYLLKYDAIRDKRALHPSKKCNANDGCVPDCPFIPNWHDRDPGERVTHYVRAVQDYEAATKEQEQT